MLKVASYNIHKAVGTDRKRNPERVLDVLAELDADVIALQEADRRFGARAAVLPNWLVSARTPYRAAPLGMNAESMGWHGNALLLRDGVELVDCEQLHLPCLEPRGAFSARLARQDVTVRIVGMHLDLSGLWRRRQAAAILHHVEQAESADAVVMMGDLNEWRPHQGCLRDFARLFAFAPCGRSFHATRPIGALDRIMWQGGLELVDCGVHASALARHASDHLPIWAQFAFPTKPAR